MKKLLIMIVATSMMAGINAQDAAEKKFLAGLAVGTGMNFNDAGTNAIDTKVGADFFAGMSLDWHFSKNVGLSTGLEFDFNRFRHVFNDSAYFDFNDKDILQRGNSDDDGFNVDEEGIFHMNERRYRNIYLSLPVMLRFQTNYMGYLRYFGKFGIRNSLLLATSVDNYGNYIEGGSGSELMDMTNSKGLSFYKGSIGLSLGAEWNFAGSTCLVGELGYFYGFTEIHQQNAITGDESKNRSIYRNLDDNKENRDYYSPSAKQGQLILKVAVLF